jgi:hypothetical protein
VALAARSVATRVGRIYAAAEGPVLTAIEEHVRPGGEVFIYPYAPMDYFLTGTSNPTRYSTLCFDFKFGSSSQREEVTRTLEQRKVRYVVWDHKAERRIGQLFFPKGGPGRFLTQPYFEAHYKPIWADGETQLMERKAEYEAR